MKSRNELLTSIAITIQDYRAGEIAQPTPAHVARWVNQFDSAVQDGLLLELDHVLSHTYLNRERVTTFLKGLLSNVKLAGDDPCEFWKRVKFLNSQGGGNSQREMLALFNDYLQESCGLKVSDCGKDADTFIYLDDAVFTGNRVLKDLKVWVEKTAPAKAIVHIITIAFHRGGERYANKSILQAAASSKKEITLKWWRIVELEDQPWKINQTDVLRPRTLSDDPLVAEYVKSFTHAITFRDQDGVGENKFFSCEQGRALLEQEMLKAGARIRRVCPNLGKYQRPLGNMVLETLGFGSTIVTFRNCPNNTPLAFWAGDPWYPLFPRKTN